MPQKTNEPSSDPYINLKEGIRMGFEKLRIGEAQVEVPHGAKNKLAVVNESIGTHRMLVKFAGDVKAFLSREFGEHLPGERPDVDALLTEIADIEGTI